MATRIAPDWVLTAGHCVKYFATTGDRTTTLRASTDEATPRELAVVHPDRCFVHPDVASTGVTARCEDVPEGTAAINAAHDVALLHVSPGADDGRWAALPSRPLTTARICVGVPFAARVRGQEGLGMPAYSGRLGHGTAMASLDLLPYENDVGDQVQGDSGGALTAAGSDDAGPVLGVLSKVDLATTDALHAATGFGSNLEWIWSVIDGSGVCVRSDRPSPCVLRVAGVPQVAGDGICSGTETNETAPTDCGVALLDTDRDGLPDVRDLCPEVYLATGVNHADMDEDNVGDECERPESVAVCGNDLDFDGVQDDIDNCPEIWNRDQADCDGVGPGDACDLDGNDADSDGSPDQCDNCPQPNPDQRNCNYDAEAAAGVTHTPGDMGLGDLCDPNPCPDGTMGIVAREFLRRDPLAPPVTVASSAAFAGTGRQASADGAYDTPTGIRTSFRWCPCADGTSDDITARQTCRGTSQCEIGFERLDDPPDGTWGWHVPSVQYPGAGSAGLDPAASPSPYGACVGRDLTLRPAQCIATYNPAAPLPRDLVEWVDHFRGSRPLSFVAYWDFETDARALGALAEGPGASPSTQGVYWYRANEYEGKPAFVALLPADSCNRVGGCPASGAGAEFTFASDLTSHYSSGRIDSMPTGPVSRPLAFLGWWLASRATCATCASSFPRPPLTEVRCGSAACTSPEIFGRLSGTRELALTPLFSPQALAALREPGVLFVHASEVADERPESGVPFVTLDDATLALRTVFAEASGSLGVFQGQGGPNDGPFAAVRTAGSSPGALSGARPLLVGETGTLYRIGGLEAGAPRAYFVRERLATGVVSATGILGPSPAEVLAVTLDSRRHEAIVLDRVAGGRPGVAHERVRVLRLDLESGRSRVIASVRSFRAFTDHYLAQAPGGSFVLAVSRRGVGYRLVHFTLPVDAGPVTVLGAYVARGRNLEGPIVAESMGVNVAETGSPWRPVGVRWLDFRERSDRGNDFDDCF